jgi:hypothetical protein
MRAGWVSPRVVFWVAVAVLAACNNQQGGCSGSNVTLGSLSFLGGPLPPNPDVRQPFKLTVQAFLPDGGLDTGFNGAVTIAIDHNPVSGVLSPVSPSVNAVGGVALFGGVSIDTAGSGYTLNATSPNFMGAVSSPFDVAAVCQISPPSSPSSTPFALASGTSGVPYAQQLSEVACGTGVTWTLSGNPSWLSVDNTGKLSGIPTQGTFTFTATVAGSGGNASQAYQIVVSAAVSSNLHSISGRIFDSSGTPFLGATVDAGTVASTSCGGGYILAGLADGVYLVAASVGDGGYAFSPSPLQVTLAGSDSPGNDFTATPQGCAFQPESPLGINLPPATQGIFYGPVDVGVSGCGNAGLVLDGGALPPGLTLNNVGLPSTATISGTPVFAGVNATFTVKAFGTTGVATQLFGLSTVSGCGIPQTFLPNGAVGNPYRPTTLLASNGCGTGLSWAVSGGTLPPGLTLGSATGTLAGIPTTPGVYHFSAGVTGTFDAGTVSATQAYVVTVNPQCGFDPPGIAPAPTDVLFPALEGRSYTQNLTPLVGCQGAFFDVQLVTGSFSPGLAFNLGGVQGTPTATGRSDFVVSICGATAVGSQAYEIEAVAPANCVLSPGLDPSTPFALPDAHLNGSYSVLLTPSAPCGHFNSGGFTVVGGNANLPAGLSLTGIGAIQGTPTDAGQYSFSVMLTADAGTTQPYTLDVVSP